MMTGKIFRVIKISLISIVSFFTLILFLPELFPGTVSRKIKGFVNENIEGELSFAKARFSLLKHFPALTISLIDFSLKGSQPYANDTLIAGKELAFGLDIFTVFKERVSINRFFLEDAFINIQVDSLGNGNYNIVKSSADTISTVDTSASGANLRIERISITNTRFVYHDRSLPILLAVQNLNYEGNGDLTKEIVDLASKLNATGVDFTYDGEKYANDKTLDAELVTRINTGNLELSFTKNDLLINQLPVDFTGFIRFPESGYDIDLRFKSDNTNLGNVITVLPPPYLKWLNETDIKGTSSLFLNFIGSYRAETNENPSLLFGLDIKDGFVKHAEAAMPLSDMGMKFRLGIPSMDYNSFYVHLDTLHVKMGQGFVQTSLHFYNLNTPRIQSVFKANADLGQLMQAVGYKDISLQGNLVSDAMLNYNSATDFNAKTRRMPYALANISWKKGFLQTPYYPAPISDIDMKVSLSNTAGTYRDMKIDLQPITFSFEGQPFMIKADVDNFENLRYDVVSKGNINLEKIAKVFIPESYGVKVHGHMETDLRLKGTQSDAAKGLYSRLNNSGTLVLKDVWMQSDELPYPVVISKGNFYVQDDKLNAENLLLEYGSNKLRLKGYYNNLFPFMVGTGPLRGGLTVESDKLNLNEFLAYPEGENSTVQDSLKGKVETGSETGVAMLPKDLDLNLEANIKEAVYDKFVMRDVKGELSLSNGKLNLKEAGASLAGAKALINAYYEPVSTKKALFDVDIKADSFDIQRFYKEVPLFAEMAPSAGMVKGQVSLVYKIGGRLDANMMPVMPSLKGGGTLSLHNVEVKGLKLFSAVAQKTGKDSINNPNLKAVNLNTTIANNVMTLERTRMRIFGFRPRIEGQASLDGRLNLRFRLGLPPFGIIGIPMTITGTMENPNIKMRRGKEADEIEEETEENEE
jgi:AsmA protein